MAEQSVFTGFAAGDLWFLAEGALRTLELTLVSGLAGTALGFVLGLARFLLPAVVGVLLGVYVDLLRSVPLLVQFILVNTAIAILGHPQPPFAVGVLVLGLYTSALVSEVVGGGLAAVPDGMRRAARSLGMNWLQELRHVVVPIGLRAAFPGWVGVVLGLAKDTSLIAVIGYIELLRAAQIIVTRTQQPLLVLGLVGLFYFLLCYPFSLLAARLERRIVR